MNIFSIPLQVRWSDIDANKHLRHSVYYDYGAFCRMMLFTELGISIKKLEELKIGPILFREEAVFRREILFEDKLTITLEMVKATADYARWSFRHQILKDDNTLAAIINIDGAWIDTEKRKLAVPSQDLINAFLQIPKGEEFEIQITKK